jgi:hypothetical protein
MLRVEVSEAGREPLPPLDIDDARFVIGSSPSARIRLPASAAKPEHVVVDVAHFTVPAELAIGPYTIRITAAPAGTQPSPPQRTESIARELMRALLGADDAASMLEVQAGPVIGATRRLAPPESTLVIGRGDEADWIILDADLSRTHAELRRSWDGTRVVDLGSKNGTRVDGVRVPAGGTLLRSGATIELGSVVVRFRDPADVQPDAPAAPPPPSLEKRAARPSTLPFYGAVAIMIAALLGLGWLLAT